MTVALALLALIIVMLFSTLVLGALRQQMPSGPSGAIASRGKQQVRSRL